MTLNETAQAQSILALARAGATGRAWTAFAAADFAHAGVDPSILTLKGRLLKDRARSAADAAERERLFAESAEAYAAAAEIAPASYPLINAATMALFAGDNVKAQSLAAQVETMIASGLDRGETPYWREATRAEALLLLGRPADAVAALDIAIGHAPQAWEDLATTLRQFRLIGEYRGERYDWLGQYAPPPSLYYSGLIGLASDDLTAAQMIADAVESLSPGFAYGALAAGADILIAEAAVALGAELHVILPAMAATFCAVSVAPYGAGWVGRFNHLLGEAVSVQIIAPDIPYSHAAIAVAAEVALGGARQQAQRMESRVEILRVVADGGADAVAQDALRLVLPRSAASADDGILASAEKRVWLATGGDIPTVTCFADLDEALAQAVIEQNEQANVALDYQVSNGGDAVEEIQRARVVRIAQAAIPGTIIAGPEAAMAIVAADANYHLEPLGEMASNDGPIALYAIRLQE